MTRVGQELEALQSLSATAQDAVAALANGVRSGCELSIQLQGLDILTQHLGALAAFVEDLATALPPSQQVGLATAVARMQLGRLRSRLTDDPVMLQDDAAMTELF